MKEENASIQITAQVLSVWHPPAIMLDLSRYSDFLAGDIPAPASSDHGAWHNINLCSDVTEAMEAAVIFDCTPRWRFVTRVREAFKVARAMHRVWYLSAMTVKG